ncbi:MAG: 30S ribosomal protein S12 methylthiotransferase RimO [Lachnospiraceae bacterium]|nr:30S ribosomal protein S12 methylthiotransferase RimO [Lachnospiraceae bacterium]
MKILFISLGCDKNLTDSEEMLSRLAEAGHEITDSEEEADAVVINTCCFIGDAKKESIDTILSFADRRTSGSLKALVIAGCLAQRYTEEILEQIPEVDSIVGTMSTADIADALESALNRSEGKAACFLEPLDSPLPAHHDRLLSTGGHYAYLKIAEGCAKHCTYCVIPSVRGPYRSCRMEDLVAEAKSLAEKGVRELILVAQETTLYGTDLYGRKSLHILLEKLSQIEGIAWIRLMYCYPEEIYPELTDAIRDLPKVLHYIDMPVQHASDRILRLMGRNTTGRELEETVSAIRRKIPDICIRTTLLCGFPGETEEDHQILMEFASRMRFDRLGVFAYSREEGTPAAQMKPQITKKIKEKRRKDLMLLQQQIVFEEAAKMTGRKFRVMVEGRVSGENVFVARTYRDAPDVDGFLFFESETDFMSGDMTDIVVTGSKDYDLIGEEIRNDENESAQ